MTRVLRSATKKCQSKEELSSKLSISKKSKTIKRTFKKIIEVKNENNEENDIWNISSISSKIFAYADPKDLIEFNTVCKKWNHISNPIIHKSIKLNRNWDIIKRSHDKRLNKYGKIDADVVECISNNTKHAPLIKGLFYDYRLEPQRAIEVFRTFRFISKLTISSLDMSQDQFLGMISPLTQLQELTLKSLQIKRITYKRLCKEVVQLPSSLKKLSIRVVLIDNPELFIQTINSHKNLTEFSYYSCSDDFLEPFYKHYPSLVKFEYGNQLLESSQSLINIFEQNHQLNSLKLNLNCLNSELTRIISSHLINMEELNLCEFSYSNNGYEDIFLKFSQPTKIKKLKLEWLRMSNCSLDSILLNCPQLEELDLNRFNSYQRLNSEIYINIFKSANIKKLTINCQNLSVNIFNTILSNCFHLNELVVILPIKWKNAIKSIYEKCTNLQKLDICPYDRLWGQERATFFKEFYESGLFTGNSKIQSTLTHLTLKQFLAVNSKADHFSNFKNLKSTKYINQAINNYRNSKSSDIEMGLWSGYKLYPIYINEYCDDFEFKKLN
jgi:hypothetical protein